MSGALNDPGEPQLPDDDRPLSDAALYANLCSANFNEETWTPAAEQLVKYGFRILNSWIKTGRIVHECRKHGHGGVSVPLALRRLDHEGATRRRSLIGETVARALAKFKHRLRHREWNPEGGRSLGSFFIASCLYEFPNVLRNETRQDARWNKAIIEEMQYFADPESDPEDHPNEASVLLEQLLEDEDAETSTIVRLTFDGYTPPDIADKLDILADRVRRKLREFRKRHSDRLGLDLEAGDEQSDR